LVFYSSFVTGTSVFSITSYGLIAFTPTNDHVGNHSALISVTDNQCDNDSTWLYYNFSVSNTNDAPYLVSSIPDQSLIEDIQLMAFFLDDYFTDPDGDDLTYTHTLTSDFTITITGANQVVIDPVVCPSEAYVIFTASDPYNLTADSNAVKLTCYEQAEPGGGSGGGSGGGGGGSGTDEEVNCTTKLVCFDWEDCIENNTQKRKCIDENGCKDDLWYLWRECNYISACYNGLWDQGEEDIDCGGPCPPCISCFDGIQNQGEEDVDCGGPCKPCKRSNIIFGELALKQNSSYWNLSLLDKDSNTVIVLDHDLTEIPFASYSYAGAFISYVKDGDLWKVTQISNVSFMLDKLLDSGNISSVSYYYGMYDEKILYTEDTVEAGGTSSLLFSLDPDSLESEQILFADPAYYVNGIHKSLLIGISTIEYTWNMTESEMIKGYQGYVFGKVVLEKREGDVSKIVIINNQGKVLHEFSYDYKDLYAPRVSPEGDQLVYFGIEDGAKSDIWLQPLNGSPEVRLTNTPDYNEIFPMFSREGDSVLFSADYNGNYNIYEINLTTLDISTVLTSPNNIFPFDWYLSPSCYDGIQNQDEVSIDCGGICGSCGTCFDGIRNQNEVGIDCGGICSPCVGQEKPAFYGLAQFNTRFLYWLLPLIIIIILFIIFHKKILKTMNAVHEQLVHKMKK
ncbi:MAG: hypothetical protein ABIH52_01000, partial [Candidatus Aenigmatarchaeota archaeon]